MSPTKRVRHSFTVPPEFLSTRQVRGGAYDLAGEVIVHLGAVLNAIDEYLVLRDQEKELRQQLRAIGTDQAISQALQATQLDLRKLAMRFFQWGYDAEDLRKVDSLEPEQLKEMVLRKVSYRGLQQDAGSVLPGTPMLDEALKLARFFVIVERFEEAIDAPRLDDQSKQPAHQAIAGDTHKTIIAPVAEQAAPAGLVAAQMKVDEVVIQVLNHLQASRFPRCIRDNWRLFDLVKRRVVVDVRLNAGEPGQAGQFNCSVWAGQGTTYLSGLSNGLTADALQTTIEKLLEQVSSQPVAPAAHNPPSVISTETVLVPEEPRSFREDLKRYDEMTPAQGWVVKSEEVSWQARKETARRVGKFTLARLLGVAVMLAVGVFVIVIIVNLGGHMDDMYRADIDEMLMFMPLESFPGETDEEKYQAVAAWRKEMEHRFGLDKPFLLRAAIWAKNGLLFEWGTSNRFSALSSNSNQVKDIILDYLPKTLLMAGLANVLMFFFSIGAALFLSRRRGSLVDWILVILTPISTMPNWIIGLLLIYVFALWLGWAPISTKFSDIPPDTQFEYFLMLARHLVLPVMAVFLGAFFQGVYIWRAFFLAHTGEDYVEMARAKGLPPGRLAWRYLLLPTLPALITNFLLMLVGFWQASLALERLFRWEGIGYLFLEAFRFRDVSIMVGLFVIFAYLQAFSVLLLDLIYALVDPRVRIEDQQQGAEYLKSPWRDRGARLVRWIQSFRKSLRLPMGTEIRGAVRVLVDTLTPEPRHQRSLRVREFWQWLLKYPQAGLGILWLVVLVVVGAYTVIRVPYSQMVVMWNVIQFPENPRYALPAWVNWFRKETLPSTISLSTAAATADFNFEQAGEWRRKIMTFEFDYPWTGFPEEVMIYFSAVYKDKLPFISITWLTPDGREIAFPDFTVKSETTYMSVMDQKLTRRLGGQKPSEGLFVLNPGDTRAQPGRYRMVITALLFDPDSDVDVKLNILGQVYGWAGTDNRRRDLGLALQWGIPVALTFGVAGAVLNTLATVFLAACAAWYRGWVDWLVQRVTEINLMIPVLPIAMMAYLFGAKNVWYILGVFVLVGIFSSTLKDYRAVLIQVREAPYIEAARAMGVGNMRMILSYLIPRLRPMMAPRLVTMVPIFVFLEATLAFLGVHDEFIPTWGRIVNDAMVDGALRGHYFWLFGPIAMVVMTGIAFALIGYALDDALNPRLRRQ